MSQPSDDAATDADADTAGDPSRPTRGSDEAFTSIRR
jgi:hypothetical protein